MKQFKEKQMERKLAEGHRRFLGPLFPKEEKVHHTTDLSMREYCNMQKKHLKAYLKGEKYFFYKKERYEVESTFLEDEEKRN